MRIHLRIVSSRLEDILYILELRIYGAYYHVLYSTDARRCRLTPIDRFIEATLRLCKAFAVPLSDGSSGSGSTT
ncbi:hypothetical protein A5717_27865 [Mycolicibacterium porcinum]|uniref:hypothetical protein n=1 Tax=Mycolicibacterium porcinum TaxID=39693 RepID=UPI00080B0CD3|nr:hypothetical protein [Mycolicibacterium porcinum]OCB08574.1 hypothetical protein A5717_27865 [Mycolicibacterium porcinum]